MRLRTKLIVATLLFTTLLTVVLSLVFLSESLRERIGETQDSNNVLTQQVLASTQTALRRGLAENPPAEAGEAAFASAVASSLRNDTSLTNTLDVFVRYSPDMQDAYVADANGHVLLSTNPALTGLPQPFRRSFAGLAQHLLPNAWKLFLGAPETLDFSLPLERNGQPFLTAHLGVRSTFLRNAYAPWLRDAALVCLLAIAGSLLVATAIAAAALKPIEQIVRELETISPGGVAEGSRRGGRDAVGRVSSTISRIDEQMRTSEQTRSEMASSLNSMLQGLRDGVMLFTPELTVAMASDAVVRFLPVGAAIVRGTPLSEAFPPGTALGNLLPRLLRERRSIRSQPITLEDGRSFELSLDCPPGEGMGVLLTLHDVAAQQELERELDVSRRLASIGRLTAGVGHEVKNPINAMVVHLELLRGKLANAPEVGGAQRHVDVLASEMGRLDRVVQALADFSRPLEPDLREQELLPIVEAVIALIEDEAAANGVGILLREEYPSLPLRVICDAEMLRQALLNVALNAMQAMPGGGSLHVVLSRDRQNACVSLRDTGVGIPEDKLDRIFDLYFTTKSAGSGIGLAMTSRIVQIHGGVIHVRSQNDPGATDHGTTFTLRLPLAVHSNPSSSMVPA